MQDGFDRLAHKRRRGLGWLLIMLCLLLGVAAFGASFGAAHLGVGKSLQILLARLTHDQALLAAFKPSEIAIVWDIRLPRLLCGVLVGMGLAVAGVIFQALLRNPLADPYTLGVSSGAAFGASLAIFLNIQLAQALPTTPLAFGMAFLTLLLVLAIAKRGGGLVASNLIIAGIILSAILSSGISFLKMLSGEEVGAIVFWLMGSLVAASWSDVALLAVVVLIGSAAAFVFADELNLMMTGERQAQALGVCIWRVNLLYLSLGAVITAACVATSGIIGFIGLVVPHILRFWLTADNRWLLVLSAALGALLLTLADQLTRLLPGSEIPVGVLTTLIGGPFFIYVFIHQQKH